MKTAREIIADEVRLCQRQPLDCYAAYDEAAKRIENRLAAEGFSIVETGRDPVRTLGVVAALDPSAWPTGCLKLNSCSRNQACMYANCRHEGRDIAVEVEAALSRSTRKGKTE